MTFPSYMHPKYGDRELQRGLHSVYQCGGLLRVLEALPPTEARNMEEITQSVVMAYLAEAASAGLPKNYVAFYAVESDGLDDILIPQHLAGSVSIICVAGGVSVATGARNTAIQTNIEQGQVLSVPTSHLRLPTRTIVKSISCSSAFYVIGDDKARYAGM